MLRNKPFILSILFSVIMAIFAGYLWMDRSNISLQLNNTRTEVERLTQDLELKQLQLEQSQELSKAADDAIVSIRDNIENKRQEQQKILKGLENVKQNAPDIDASLDANIARMLNEVCERVRGNPCPNP